jgi:hypothetical protein
MVFELYPVGGAGERRVCRQPFDDSVRRPRRRDYAGTADEPVACLRVRVQPRARRDRSPVGPPGRRSQVGAHGSSTSLRHRPRFDRSDEAFSAMVSLMLLPPATNADDAELIARLGGSRRPDGGTGTGSSPAPTAFPPTRTAALATGAVHEHGLLSAADLDRGVRDILRAAAPTDDVPRHAADHREQQSGADSALLRARR